MNTKDFLRLGVPLGEATRRATDFVAQYILRGGDTAKLEEAIKAIIASPALFAEDPLRKEFAKAIANSPPPPRAEPVNYRQWGEGIEPDAVMQMEKACRLPVSVAGDLSQWFAARVQHLNGLFLELRIVLYRFGFRIDGHYGSVLSVPPPLSIQSGGILHPPTGSKIPNDWTRAIQDALWRLAFVLQNENGHAKAGRSEREI